MRDYLCDSQGGPQPPPNWKEGDPKPKEQKDGPDSDEQKDDDK